MSHKPTFKFGDDRSYAGGRLAYSLRSFCFDLEGKFISELQEALSKTIYDIAEKITYQGNSLDSLTAAQMEVIAGRPRIRYVPISDHSRVFTHNVYDAWVNEGNLYLLEIIQVNYLNRHNHNQVASLIRHEKSFQMIRVSAEGIVESTPTWYVEETNGFPSSISEFFVVCPDIKFSQSYIPG